MARYREQAFLQRNINATVRSGPPVVASPLPRKMPQTRNKIKETIKVPATHLGCKPILIAQKPRVSHLKDECLRLKIFRLSIKRQGQTASEILRDHGSIAADYSFRCPCQLRITPPSGDPTLEHVLNSRAFFDLRPNTKSRLGMNLDEPFVVDRKYFGVRKHTATPTDTWMACRFVDQSNVQPTLTIRFTEPEGGWPVAFLCMVGVHEAETKIAPLVLQGTLNSRDEDNSIVELKFCHGKYPVIGAFSLLLEFQRDWIKAPASTVINESSLDGRLPARRHRVTFRFASSQKRKDYEKECHEYDWYNCPFCLGREFDSREELHFHLIQVHDRFAFTFSKSTRLSNYTVIDVVTGPNTPKFELQNEREFVWHRPRESFNMARYLGGDHSWADFTADSAQPKTKPARKRLEGIPYQVPVTTTFTVPKTTKGVGRARKSRLKTVPVTRRFPTKLARSKTKRLLETGEEISDSEDEIDDSWIGKKHRDTILHSDEITDSEKRLMITWSDHIRKERPIGYCHVPTSLRTYIVQNTTMLSTSEMRLELWKHMLTFLQAGIIDAKDLDDCMALVEPQAGSDETKLERMLKTFTVDPISVQSRGPYCDPAVPKCHGKWTNLDMLACANDFCKTKFYHLRCMGLKRRPDEWFCADCDVESKSHGLDS